MSDSFKSDWKVWSAVLARQKVVVGIFFGLMTLLVVIFLQVFWGYQWYLQQMSYLTAQVEIVAEIDSALDPTQYPPLQTALEDLSGVQTVDFWPVERSLQYVDQQILPGYEELFRSDQLSFPVGPLFRITLTDLNMRADVERVIRDRFAQQLFIFGSPVVSSEGSLSAHFFDSLRSWDQLFFGFLMLQLAFFLLFSGYITSALIQERMKEFHLPEFLGFSPPFPFWSGLLFVMMISLASILMGVVISSFLVGELLLGLAGLVLILMWMVDLGVVVMHRLVGR